MDIQPINQKAEGDLGYVAGYQSRTIGIYAPSLSAAARIAETELKVSKRNRGLLWVNLVERNDGSVVTQSTAL